MDTEGYIQHQQLHTVHGKPFPERDHLVSWPRVIWVWPNQGYRLFVGFSCVFFFVVWFCLLIR